MWNPYVPLWKPYVGVPLLESGISILEPLGIPRDSLFGVSRDTYRDLIVPCLESLGIPKGLQGPIFPKVENIAPCIPSSQKWSSRALGIPREFKMGIIGFLGTESGPMKALPEGTCEECGNDRSLAAFMNSKKGLFLESLLIPAAPTYGCLFGIPRDPWGPYHSLFGIPTPYGYL